MDWREVRLEDVGEFVGCPPAARDGLVVVLPSVGGHCTQATIDRKLSAVSAVYSIRPVTLSGCQVRSNSLPRSGRRHGTDDRTRVLGHRHMRPAVNTCADQPHHIIYTSAMG